MWVIWSALSSLPSTVRTNTSPQALFKKGTLAFNPTSKQSRGTHNTASPLKSRSMSAPSEASAKSSTHSKTQEPSSLTVKKGKWYDCLRPVPGYQGFGGGPDSGADDKITEEEKEAHARIQDYTTKVPSFHRAKAKKDSK